MIKTDSSCRQTISGEHGLDSNGVYVTVVDFRSVNPSLTAVTGTTELRSSSSSG